MTDFKSISQLCKDNDNYALFSRSRFVVKDGSYSFVRDYFGWIPSCLRSAQVKEQNKRTFQFFKEQFDGNDKLLQRYASEKKGLKAIEVRKILIILALELGYGDALDYGLDHDKGLNRRWKETAKIAKNFIENKQNGLTSFSQWDSLFYSKKVDDFLLKEARSFQRMKQETILSINCSCEAKIAQLSQSILDADKIENKHFYSFKRRIVISEKEGKFSSSVKKDFMRWVPHFLCRISKKRMKEERETLRWFENQFGTERIKRLSQFYNLSLYGRALYQTDLRKLLIALSVITEEDMGKSSEGWDYQTCLENYRKKIPTLNEEQLFMADDAYEEKELSMKLGDGMGVTAFVGRSILRNVIGGDKAIKKQTQWDYKRCISMIWSSSMPKTHIPTGTLFVEPKGCRVFSEIFSFYGGYACLFKAREKKEKDTKPWDDEIQFTGTIPKPIAGFHSICQDLLPGIGSLGFLKLTKSEKFQQFIESKKENKSLKISGYSLGGVYAQYLTAYLRKQQWTISSLLMINAPKMPSPVTDEEKKNIGVCKFVTHAGDMTCLGGYSRYQAMSSRNRIYILGRRVSDKEKQLPTSFDAIFPEAKKKFWSTFFYIMKEINNHFYERDWHCQAIKLTDKGGSWSQKTKGEREVSLSDPKDVQKIADHCFPAQPHESSWEIFRSVFVKIIAFIFSSTIGLIAQLGEEIGESFANITHISYLR